MMARWTCLSPRMAAAPTYSITKRVRTTACALNWSAQNRITMASVVWCASKAPSVTVARLLLLAPTLLAAAPRNDSNEVTTSEAARLNNLGCAYMNQQLFEEALKSYDESSRLHPKLAVARVNQGIALSNLQR